FSFFPTKVLTTAEGGIVTTDDEQVYRKSQLIRNHGKNPELGNRMTELGNNLRISEVTALLGVNQMRKAAEIVRERQRTAGFYDRELPKVAGVRPLELGGNVTSGYYKYVAYLDEDLDRAQVKRLMKERHGVSLTGEVYVDLCHTEPLWERFTYCGKQRAADGSVVSHRWPGCPCDQPEAGFPGSEYIAKHHICLPLYPGLTEAEAAYVVGSLDQTLRELRPAGRS
ncbi:MAG: DegT/DnrJ/EryC1/StrS family aminotransferase, partial [Chloroflexi bacterium]|nr:DegT/DnrJ/EryC1/StrS family aminotransferase [Chloroflexota bacterium]